MGRSKRSVDPIGSRPASPARSYKKRVDGEWKEGADPSPGRRCCVDVVGLFSRVVRTMAVLSLQFRRLPNAGAVAGLLGIPNSIRVGLSMLWQESRPQGGGSGMID